MPKTIAKTTKSRRSVRRTTTAPLTRLPAASRDVFGVRWGTIRAYALGC